jgi:Zinc finger, C3HC4 type (RING finger)
MMLSYVAPKSRSAMDQAISSKTAFYFAPGDYESNFSVDTDRVKILNRIYFGLHHLLERLSHQNVSEAQLDAAARIHLHNLKAFLGSNEKEGFTGFQLTMFCISCLFQPAYSTLPCGHSFCKECIRAYGLSRTKTVVELYECPIHPNSSLPVSRHSGSTFVWGQSRSIYITPKDARIRMLSLDE